MAREFVLKSCSE